MNAASVPPAKTTKRATGTKAPKPSGGAKSATAPAKAAKDTAAKTRVSKAATSEATGVPAKRPAAPRSRKSAATGDAPRPLLDAGRRSEYIAVAAYFIAERRGFQGSYEFDDWVSAEAEIESLLRDGKLIP
jgi:hypothetical protein